MLRPLLFLLSVFVLTAGSVSADPQRSPAPFRVCADPNNLPFSNSKQAGFENKIAQVLAHALHSEPQYTWWPQRRGFLRNTLDAGVCDVVMGIPAEVQSLLTTRPYYRSTYVFVTPQTEKHRFISFDDPELRRLKIGVHLIGDDYANSPPAHLLAAKGIVNNVVGYSVFGDYGEDSPPGKLIQAVAAGEVGIAIVWGPIAGYFAKQQAQLLTVTPVPIHESSATLPLTYRIALGVRKRDVALQARLDDALEKHRAEVHKILEDYGVPLVQD
jgi:quinoprotein dehydrogenase-associated probable ABC transporter substrate-binding protein